MRFTLSCREVARERERERFYPAPISLITSVNFHRDAAIVRESLRTIVDIHELKSARVLGFSLRKAVQTGSFVMAERGKEVINETQRPQPSQIDMIVHLIAARRTSERPALRLLMGNNWLVRAPWNRHDCQRRVPRRPREFRERRTCGTR